MFQFILFIIYLRFSRYQIWFTRWISILKCDVLVSQNLDYLRDLRLRCVTKFVDQTKGTMGSHEDDKRDTRRYVLCTNLQKLRNAHDSALPVWSVPFVITSPFVFGALLKPLSLRSKVGPNNRSLHVPCFEVPFSTGTGFALAPLWSSKTMDDVCAECFRAIDFSAGTGSEPPKMSEVPPPGGFKTL